MPQMGSLVAHVDSGIVRLLSWWVVIVVAQVFGIVKLPATWSPC